MAEETPWESYVGESRARKYNYKTLEEAKNAHDTDPYVRKLMKDSLKKRQATLAGATERVAAAAAAGKRPDTRSATMVSQGGYRHHATEADAQVAADASLRDANTRVSADLLTFMSKHVVGCCEAGCPLGASAETKDCDCEFAADHPHRVPVGLRVGVQAPVFHCHLACDHVDPEGLVDPAMKKVDAVSQLRGEARLLEWLKTRVVCLWHHFLHTRVQMGLQPVSAMPASLFKQWVQLKLEHQCEHPDHGAMPYAGLIPTVAADPLMHGFLERSELLRGQGAPRSISEAQRAERHLQHVNAGEAHVHCSFCHALWTLCEDAQLSEAEYIPYTINQFEKLKQAHPTFVEYQRTVSDGFDFKAQREATSAAQSAAKKKKEN